jgi:hypothetical protein
MRIAQSAKLSPEALFLYWIQEREAIRCRRAAKKAKPWTDDEILQSYRFCNVRRMDDKVSDWLLRNWYHPYFDHPNMLTAATIARHFNKPEVLDKITGLVLGAEYLPEAALRVIQTLKANGQTVFSAAYMIHADKSADKSEMVINRVVQPIHDGVKIDSSSMQKSVEVLTGCWNIGSFMAGQIVADMRWAVSGTWADRYEWAPLGPGSQRGMNRLEDSDLKRQWRQDMFADALKRLFLWVKDELPNVGDRLEAMDVQNCLCEFDKYSRVLLGEGRPKQLYPGAA